MLMELAETTVFQQEKPSTRKLTKIKINLLVNVLIGMRLVSVCLFACMRVIESFLIYSPNK